MGGRVAPEERAETRVQTIDPWDYNKSLYVPDNTAGIDDKPASEVHNFKLVRTDTGFYWDKQGEYYGGAAPPLSYEEAKEYYDKWQSGETISTALEEHFRAFKKMLDAENDYNAIGYTGFMESVAPLVYYGFFKSYGEEYDGHLLKYNGLSYGAGFTQRENQVLVGEAELRKRYAYVQDTWQINADTVLTPSLRLDHSDLFGSRLTGNIGLLHNLGGNSHRRLKANIGTGYAEPGLGELYYNWEMYGGTSDNHWGWYWIGNPHLKPEKSLNFDLSVEGESWKTFAKVSVFHNEIKDYLTGYFTGQFIDFNFNGSSSRQTPDRIYSFRNLGKAKITGLEAEIQQKFNDHWSAKVGYTLLHAVNNSDRDMPHRLLDKPTHKFDLGLNYVDKKSGFRGAFWGSYYWHMLDSNSVTVDDTWSPDEQGIYTKKQAHYNEKSFGIWNLLLEKDFGKDFTAYVGIDNIFNHRDDDRAFQDRVYRFGVNIRMADLGEVLARPFRTRRDAEGNPVVTDIYGNDWFILRHGNADGRKKAGDVDLFGEYRVRSNMFKGENKALMRETKETHADEEAAKNHADLPGHGWEQRLRIGADYQITDDLSLTLVGSTGKHELDRNTAPQRGLHDAYLERAELTQNTKKWDWTIGRIHEPMGVTGYWFGREYDGIRGTYTDRKTQVSVGYGDFSSRTGVYDSAYNHRERAVFRRAPTKAELTGFYGDDEDHPTGQVYPEGYDPNEQFNYREKFIHAGQIQDAVTGEWKNDPSLSDVEIARKKLAVVRELLGIYQDIDKAVRESSGTKTKYYEDMVNKVNTESFYDNALKLRRMDMKLTLNNGETVDLNDEAFMRKLAYGSPINIPEPPPYKNIYIYGNGAYGGMEKLVQEDTIRRAMGDILDAAAAKKAGNITEYSYTNDAGTAVTTTNREEAIDHMFVRFVGSDTTDLAKGTTGMIGELLYHIAKNTMFNPVLDAAVPLIGAPRSILQNGYVLKQDHIPAMDRAAYIKIRRQLGDTLGLEAWKFTSYGEGAHDSHGLHEMRIADVVGLGAQVRLGGRAMLSFDYGRNRSAMGRFFHGGRNAYGDYTGGGHTPDFWVARLDIGRADTEVRGSWTAYFDYKSFDHGAYLGGTGADLPNRYLDGIRSFTAGIGYVPAKNVLLEASYTFGARSTQKRDTLYGPESFKLGDYTRLQATYKF